MTTTRTRLWSHASSRALMMVVATIMAIGAVFGAMNTMYAAVAARTAEIGTLRALGFGPGSVMASFLLDVAGARAGGRRDRRGPGDAD